jgi:3-oxoacyl-[acyl-carrier-protein] synthase-1
VTPVYLQRAAMHCALGDDLHSAALAFQAGQPAQAQTFLLHEVHEPRNYLPAARTA